MSQEQFRGFIDTPPLWTNQQFSVRQFDFPNVDAIQWEPSPIPNRIRLGHQMERVFEHLIKTASPYDILIHNLPIKDGNRTIGEIDFILRERGKDQKDFKRSNGGYVHVELTYKFYIIDTQITEPIHQLMGPNRRDMFFTKLEKVKQRQFPLLHSTQGSKVLAERGIDVEQIEHQCCFKSQLFMPFGTSQVHIRPLNQACISGYWLRFDDFNMADFASSSYYIPFKSEWVVAPHAEVGWKSHFGILMDINLRMLKENAPMVWMRTLEGKFEKFFVVWW